MYGSISYRTSLVQQNCLQQIIEDKFLVNNFKMKSTLIATYNEVRQNGINEVRFLSLLGFKFSILLLILNIYSDSFS